MAGRGRSGGRKATIDLGSIFTTLQDLYGDRVELEEPSKAEGPGEGSGEGSKARPRFKAKNFFSKGRASELNAQMTLEELKNQLATERAKDLASTTNKMTLERDKALKLQELEMKPQFDELDVLKRANEESIRLTGLPLKQLTPQQQQLMADRATRLLEADVATNEAKTEEQRNRRQKEVGKRDLSLEEGMEEQAAKIAGDMAASERGIQTRNFLRGNPNITGEQIKAALDALQAGTASTKAELPGKKFLSVSPGETMFDPTSRETLTGPYDVEEPAMLGGVPIPGQTIKRRMPFSRTPPALTQDRVNAARSIPTTPSPVEAPTSGVRTQFSERDILDWLNGLRNLEY